MFFVDEDIAALDQRDPFPVVRPTRDVVEGTAETGFEEEKRILCGGDVPIEGRWEWWCGSHVGWSIVILVGLFYDDGGVWEEYVIRRRRRRSRKRKGNGWFNAPARLLGRGEQGLYQTFDWRDGGSEEDKGLNRFGYPKQGVEVGMWEAENV